MADLTSAVAAALGRMAGFFDLTALGCQGRPLGPGEHQPVTRDATQVDLILKRVARKGLDFL